MGVGEWKRERGEMRGDERLQERREGREGRRERGGSVDFIQTSISEESKHNVDHRKVRRSRGVSSEKQASHNRIH